MSLNRGRLAKALFIWTLGLGSLMGVPMSPEEVEELLYSLNQPKITETIPEEDDQGEPPLGVLGLEPPESRETKSDPPP